MTEEEFLRRIDGHIEVANEHMARGNEISARGSVIFDETRAALAGLRESIEDMRVEMRQCNLRGQRVAEQFETEIRMARKERLEEGPKTRAKLDDLLAESRAGRDALFVILDEIRGRGPGPAPAGA
jgi:hypothetical protein